MIRQDDRRSGWGRPGRWATFPVRMIARGGGGFMCADAVVRRIFDDYAHGGHSLREIIRRLAADNVPSPTGRRRC